MKKNWMSVNARLAYKRGLQPFDDWSISEIKAKIEENKENIPEEIYDFLHEVSGGFLKEIFLCEPLHVSPFGAVYCDQEYHHFSDEDGNVYIDYFYRFRVPNFDDPSYSLQELRAQYAEYDEYLKHLCSAKRFEEWDKASIIGALEQYGVDGRIVKLLNGCSLEFLRYEFIQRTKIYNFRYQPNGVYFVIKDISHSDPETLYEELKAARDTWRLRKKLAKEAQATNKACQKAIFDQSPCSLCQIRYTYGRRRILASATAVKKGGRFFLRADEYHPNGWSIGENTQAFISQSPAIQELPINFDYKAWQLSKEEIPNQN